MKLASLKAGRDGRLAVVSRDQTRVLTVPDVTPTMQAALEDWDTIAPRLAEKMEAVEQRHGEAFDPSQCSSPLPRAYQWADGSAYVVHVELVRKARGASMPENFWHSPLMYQGGSDTFLG